MRDVKYSEVVINGGFWREIQDINSRVTVNAIYDRFAETGRIAALECARVPGGGTPKAHPFWDSDCAKWIEAASYILALRRDPELESKVERMIDAVIRNQWTDGYINSYYTVAAPEKRFTVRTDHELYTCGHLIEAAIAYFEATGKDRFLNAVCRFADLVDCVFRVEDSAAFSTPRHEEIELALFRLWRVTGEERYKTLAEYFITARGRNAKDAPGCSPRAKAKVQDVPYDSIESAVGHCVCATYQLAGLADMAYYNGDQKLFARCRKIFDDIVGGKMYITGGLGSTYHGESFTVPFDLPPDGAYTETCASVGMIRFCTRMLRQDLDSAYSDVIETELYNGLLSGVSLSGDSFFYENPLEINLSDRGRITCTDEFEHWQPVGRKKVFECSCCPPNICRALAAAGGLLYSVGEGEAAVHQYASSEYVSGDVSIAVETAYPADGVIKIKQRGLSVLKLRIPGWCRGFRLDSDHTVEKGYAVVASPAEEITLFLDMDPQAVWADARVRAVSGRVAVRRGPVVYCAESVDNSGVMPHMLRLSLPLEAKTVPGFSGLPDLFVRGKTLLPGASLYSFAPPSEKECIIKLIPYRAFANRGESDMAVWLYTENSR